MSNELEGKRELNKESINLFTSKIKRKADLKAWRLVLWSCDYQLIIHKINKPVQCTPSLLCFCCRCLATPGLQSEATAVGGDVEHGQED